MSAATLSLGGGQAGPVDVRGHVDRLFAVIDRLSTIVTGENAALDAGSAAKLVQTQDEKALLAAQYANEMQLLGQNSNVLNKLPTEVRDRLKSAVRGFQDLLHAHAKKIVVMKSVTEGMIDSVAAEARRKSNPVQGYSRNGRLEPTATAAQGLAARASLALNQTI